uniref:Uncharacterized protein n=1 Tax=Anguilla anguilla TaxID=7936 RepID=A0A0E9XM54_ANGAN
MLVGGEGCEFAAISKIFAPLICRHCDRAQ